MRKRKNTKLRRLFELLPARCSALATMATLHLPLKKEASGARLLRRREPRATAG